MTLLAVLLVMTAAALALPGLPSMTWVSADRDRPLPRALLCVAAGSVVAALWSWLEARQLALVLILAAAALGVLRLVRRRRAVRAAGHTADQVLLVCESLASDLASGQPSLAALGRAASEWPDFAPVAAAGQMGADVPAALRELAQRSGAGQLRVLAATWQVAHHTGTGLADAICTAAESIRSEHRTARLVSAELAAAHATARMLAVLPLGVLLLGAGVGGDPVGFLLRTTPGLVCLALGSGLSFAGLLWLERIADRVLRP